ncbi:MAG: cell division protein FtsZ [Candidatus Hydrogenedentes bacterium]|nr:cell division protein FtsZ [Candidatus Hydrogenedentota bacterium]
MSDEFQSFEQRAIIKVCGIGGGGGNAVGRMVEAGLADVEFITINTDAQALRHSPAGTRLQIGVEQTGGLGSGALPEKGARAAEEDRERIKEVLGGADMVFLTAGLGGGTGTGASPIVAQEATSTGALTVAIVTLPFSFEGRERMASALRGLAALEEHVDTLIVVPNDRVATLCQESMSLKAAFHQADEVLHNGVRAISELITVPGLINLDFADVRTIMQARGRALMGIGIAEGERRAVRAAEEAIVCPLLEQSNINGAMGVIVNIKGGCDIGMREVTDAVNVVKDAAHPDANIIFGAVIDDEERPELQVTVIAAGFPRGVSENYLTGDGAKTYAARRDARRRPDGAHAHVMAPAAATATATAAAEEDTLPALAPAAVANAPAEQFLFPDTPPEPAEPEFVPEPESDEDMGIPAFIRRRMKKR